MSTAAIVAIMFAIGDDIKALVYFPGHIKSPYSEVSVEGITKFIAFDFAMLLMALCIG